MPPKKSKNDRKGKVPIVVGGTGLYIESLLYSVSHSGEAEPNFELRDELEEYAKNSNQELWKKLDKIDPEAAEKFIPTMLDELFVR